MMCIVYSKSKNIPYNVWTKIRGYDKSKCECQSYDLHKLMSHSGGSLVDKDAVIKAGFGFFVKLCKKICVITCHHITGTMNIESNAYASNIDNVIEKIPLKIIGSIPELDISVLEFVDNDQEKKFTHTVKSNIYQKLSYVGENLEKIIIRACSIVGTSENKIINISAPTSKATIINDYVKSIIVPKFPIIRYKCDLNDFSEKIKYEGLSGSLLMIDDNAVGMNISINEEKIDALPISLIIKLAESLVLNPKRQMCGYHFTTRVVNDTSNPKMIYHYIKKTDDNSYPTFTKKKFRFKTGDIITKLNDIKFNYDGEIYDPDLEFYFPIKTYLTITHFCDDGVKFNIIRTTTESQKEITQIIGGIKFDNAHYVNIFNNHKYIYWKGFTFVELSEELIIDMNKVGINLEGEIYNNFTIAQNNNDKIIVLIDVDFQQFSKEYAYVLQNSGFPYVKVPGGYQLLPIKKIDTKQICSISDLEKSLIEPAKKKILHYSKNASEYKLIV